MAKKETDKKKSEDKGTSADIPAMKSPKVGVPSDAPNEGTPKSITKLPKGGRRIDY